MGLKEELEEKAESCQSTEDFVELAKEVMSGVSDKEWAERLFEDAVYWAETAGDFTALTWGAVEVFQDKNRAQEYLNQGKDYCMNLPEYIELAKAAADAIGPESAKEIVTAAQAKCVKVQDFLNLSKNINDLLSDADLSKEIADKALNKCNTADDYNNFAKGVMEVFNDSDWAKQVYETATENCKTGDDFGALAKGAEDTIPTRREV